MDRVRCATCGVEHDLSDLEPGYRWPDAYLAVPPGERQFRTTGGRDHCGVRDAADTERRYFLRVRLLVPVRGHATPCGWGVWVEVSESAFARTRALWYDPEQDREPPFPGYLANSFMDYPPTLGLPGSVQLTGPKTVPTFALAPDLDHPLAREQRTGVYPERVVEWLTRQLHPGGR